MKCHNTNCTGVPTIGINSACLSVHSDRVFVGFEEGVFKTATSGFYRRHWGEIWCCELSDNLFSNIPKRGQGIRITNWHGAVPVKIEMKNKRGWTTIFQRDELPEGLACLAGCEGVPV